MRIIMHGPAAGYFWDGTIHSWGIDEVVEVDDANAEAVAWARSRCDGAVGELLEDAAEPVQEPTLADLRARAEALGLATYGSKAQLTERIANAEQEA